MGLTLAQYRTRVLYLLDDVSSVRFTTLQLDAGLQSALVLYDKISPLVRTYQLEATGWQVLALPADFAATYINRVQLYSATSKQAALEVPYKARRVDEQWQLETVKSTYSAGQVLTVTYVGKHTVDGLDGAAGSTIENDELFVMGGAAYAGYSRAVSRSESINMQPGVQAQLLALANHYMSMYVAGLRSSSVVTQAFE